MRVSSPTATTAWTSRSRPTLRSCTRTTTRRWRTRPPRSGPRCGRRGRPAAARACPARADGRHLGVRHHPRPASRGDGQRGAGRAGRDRRSRRRRRPGRHRHARGQHQRGTRQMLGDQVADAVRVVNHDARDTASLAWAGCSGPAFPSGSNHEWTDAEVRITTGFVEPDFFAGFSGGPKMVAPGLAGLETVLVLHDARRIGDSAATWGVTVGNPVHDDVRAIAQATASRTRGRGAEPGQADRGRVRR